MTERRLSKMNLGHNAQRQKVKIEFTIQIKQVLGLPKSTTGNLFIAWKRGSKKENSGESRHVSIKDQTAAFDFTLPLKGFEEKSVVFTLKEEGKSKKSNTLGKLAIDLAEFANSKTERIRTFTIKEKKAPVANITLSFKTTWLKMDGKTLIKADQAEASGKEKVHIDGNDYYLQTEDELSIDETDHKSGNDSDDDAADFDEDSEREGTNGSRRKSGNHTPIVLPKPTASPVAPQSAPTLAPPVTPTSAPSIQITTPASETKDAEDPKVKKYKKKLRNARKEVEDLRAELAKKDGQKSTQNGDPANAETAAKLAALLETEAKLRREVDEANSRVAEVQTAADSRSKAEGDAKAQYDARIRQLEDDLHQRDAAAQAADLKLKELERTVLESANNNDQGSREVEAKVREFEARVAELETQRTSAEDAAKAAEKRVRELEEFEQKAQQSAELEVTSQKKIHDLEAALSEEQRKNEENTKAATDINMEMTRVLGSLEAKIAELQRSTETKEAQDKTDSAKYLEEIERLEAENSEIESENDKLQERIKELEEQQNTAAGELSARVTQLETELARTASRTEKEAEDLQEQIESASAAEKKLEEDNQKLQKRAADLEAQLASEAGKGKVVDELQEKNEDLEEQMSRLQASSDSHKKEVEKLTAMLAELEEEKQQMKAVKSQAELTERQKKQLEEEVEMLNEKVSSLESQVQAGAGEQEELVAGLQSKNKKAEKQISSLKSLLEEAELAKDSKALDLERALAEIAEVKQKAGNTDELEEQVAKYKKKAKKAESQALAMEKQLDEMKQQQNGNADEKQKYKDLEEKYRAAKDRIEELDDETDRLKKRETVLGELNETTEKRIEELEAELRESKGRSASSANDEEVSTLQKDLEKVLGEASQLKARVRELEDAKAQAVATPSAGGGAVTDDVIRLQRDVDEYKKVEKAIYWDEIGFTAADITKTATSVWQLLAATRELDAEPRAQDAGFPLTPLAHKVVTALDKSYRRVQKDDKQVAYWLACACSLLHFVHQRDDIPPSADPVMHGVQVDREQFINGANHAEQFSRAVQDLTLNIYSQLVVNLQESFQKVVIPAFLREDLAVMDAQQRTPVKRELSFSSPNGVNSPSSPHLSHTPALPSLTILTNALSHILNILRDAHCPSIVVKQFFHQLLHFISGCVLNALLYGKEVSTATHGLRIKLAVSRIDEWLAKQENDVSGAGERLNLLRDAANVLVLDKSLFLDADTISSIFHSLNLVQVRKLLDLFQPDSVSPSNVPQSVKRMMDTYWGYSPHNMPLVVDVTSLVVVN